MKCREISGLHPNERTLKKGRFSPHYPFISLYSLARIKRELTGKTFTPECSSASGLEVQHLHKSFNVSFQINIQIMDTFKLTEGVADPPSLGENVMKKCAPAYHKFFT
jgi:hypothetical protein